MAHRLASSPPDTAAAARRCTSWPACATPVECIVTGHRRPTGARGRVPVHRARHAVRRDGPRPLRRRARLPRRHRPVPGVLLAPYLDRPLTGSSSTPPTSEALLDQHGLRPAGVFARRVRTGRAVAVVGHPPAVVAGHSVGEYVAAVVAGVFTLDDGAALVAARGRLMASLPPDGEMAAVFATEEQVHAVIDAVGEGVSIAAINGPASVALSATGGPLATRARPSYGPTASWSSRWPSRSPPIRPRSTRSSTTSRLSPPGVRFRSPRLDVVSGMTGRVAAGDDLMTATYWRRHLRQPVRFADVVRTIHERGIRTFVESVRTPPCSTWPATSSPPSTGANGYRRCGPVRTSGAKS